MNIIASHNHITGGIKSCENINEKFRKCKNTTSTVTRGNSAYKTCANVRVNYICRGSSYALFVLRIIAPGVLILRYNFLYSHRVNEDISFIYMHWATLFASYLFSLA